MKKKPFDKTSYVLGYMDAKETKTVIPQTEEWKKEIRNAYHGILSKKQIEATIKWWDNIMSKSLAQAREEERIKIVKLIEKNTDKELGTTDYDDLAKDVIDATFSKENV